MDCQLALLSSATTDLAVFCSICFSKMPGFQLFPTKAWTLPSSFRWETIASLKPFLEVFLLQKPSILAQRSRGGGPLLSRWKRFKARLIPRSNFPWIQKRIPSRVSEAKTFSKVMSVMFVYIYLTLINLSFIWFFHMESTERDRKRCRWFPSLGEG